MTTNVKVGPLSAVSLETLESVKRVLLAELSKGGWHWADEEDMDVARNFVAAIALAVEEGEEALPNVGQGWMD